MKSFPERRSHLLLLTHLMQIQYHYIRDAIEDDKIKPYHIDRARNPADILTKNLGQILFHQFHPLLGLEVL